MDVNAPTKEGVTFKFKLATAINNKGESSLTYEVDASPQVKGTILKDVTFVVSGFETQAQALDKITQLAQVAIQRLVAANFTTAIDKTKIASSGKPLKAHVVEDIKKQISNRDAQVLILPSDITITSDNTARAITIVIDNHGLAKTITIDGFSSIEDYLKLGSSAIKDYLDQVLGAIPSSGGALEIPKGITSVQFGGYVQAMGDSSTIGNDGITAMNKFAETYKAKITSLTIPSSFTTIGAWFRDFNKITSLTIPNSVTTIGAHAFYSAPLILLNIPNAITAIGHFAFYYAHLTSLTIPNSVTAIGNKAFYTAILTTLSLGDHLQTIGAEAFYYAQLTSLHIPNSVTTIGVSAFYYAPLTTLSLGDHLLSIGYGAFYRAKLTSLLIPNSVTKIGNFAFRSSLLTNVTIFQDVSLGANVFKSGVTLIRPIR